MGLEELVPTFVWREYSRTVMTKIEKPRACGFFTQEEAEARDVHLACGKQGYLEDGNQVAFYWLVDKNDGVIIDAKFQAFAESILIAAMEVTCDLLVGKNYDQARRLSAELIDKELGGVPEPLLPHLNLVIDAIDAAIEQCLEIPLGENYHSPVPQMEQGEAYPGWENLSKEQKLRVIEEVIESEVRPYIELDAGGIELIDLKDNELTIAYSGSCTSCFSAVGATLSSIQQIVQQKIHPSLTVTPRMEDLTF